MLKDFYLMQFSQVEVRRSHALFALLKNRTTVSSEFAGLASDWLWLVGLFPKLKRPQFDRDIASLVQQGWLEEVAAHSYVLTEAGQAHNETYHERHYWPQSLTQAPGYQVQHFMQLADLVTQVISEHQYAEQRYYPLQASPMIQVTLKRWLQQLGWEQATEAWLAAVVQLMTALPTETAEPLMATWVGHATPGQLLTQIALPEAWTLWDLTLWRLDQYHFWLTQAATPVVSDLYAQLPRPTLFSAAVGATLQMAQAGVPLALIAQQRRLKIGTVREHLMTAAVWLPVSDFPYDQFLTADIRDYLAQQLPTDPKAWRFQMVRESGHPDEFLLFRLYQIEKIKQGGPAHG